MWNICSHPTNPTILLPIELEVPEGYTVEAQTANPEYSVNPAAVNLGRRITVLAFRNRYTANEKMLIEFAAAHNPNAAIESQMNAAAIRAYLKDLDNASYVDLDRMDTRGGAITMEALGLLAEGRALVILDSPVLPTEIPTYPSPD